MYSFISFFSPNQINRHWRPFYLRCGYCDVNYDVIGKMETFAQDFNYIKSLRNLTSFPGGPETVPKYHSNTDTNKPDQERRILGYFVGLPKRLKMQLEDMYRLDFELFGYESRLFL